MKKDGHMYSVSHREKFQERKFSRILTFCGYSQSFIHKIGGVTSFGGTIGGTSKHCESFLCVNLFSINLRRISHSKVFHSAVAHGVMTCCLTFGIKFLLIEVFLIWQL